MLAYALQCLRGIGQRQQVVHEHIAVTGPGQMLGKRLRRVTRNQRSQLIEVGTIERAGTTDRQPDTMNRQRVVLADPAQVMLECAAFDQIVLGMAFEEREIGQRIENLLKMLW